MFYIQGQCLIMSRGVSQALAVHTPRKPIVDTNGRLYVFSLDFMAHV